MTFKTILFSKLFNVKYLCLILFFAAKSYAQIDTSKIYVKGPDMIYKGVKIGNRQLLNLVRQYPFPSTKNNLLHFHKQLRRNNGMRIAFGIYSIPTGLLGAILLAAASDKNPSNSPTAFGGLMFMSASITTISISQICNYRYHKKKKHIIALYNQFQ
jgi:hypothetical protein